MAIAMGAIALITIVAIGAFVLARQVLGESTNIQAEERAFQVAQSGLDRELSGFNPSVLQNGQYTKSGSTPDGTYVVTARPQGSSAYEYLMTSSAVSGEATESVTMRFFYLNLWDMNIGAGENASLGGGRGWNGNASITGPLYLRGDMDWSSNGAYEKGPLFIRDGALNISGSGELGKAQPIRLYATKPTTGKLGSLYLSAPQSYSVPDIELPWVDDAYLDAALALAKKESTDNLMGANSSSSIVNIETDNSKSAATYTTVVAGRVRPVTSPASSASEYKYLGGLTRAGLGLGTRSLTVGATSFGEWDRIGSVYAGTGKHDDFAFDASTGTLYVEGTVFVDGPISFTSNVKRYVGNGTLVANGNVTIQPGAKLVPKDGFSQAQALGIVTPGNVTVGGNQDSFYTGAIFCNGQVGLYGVATEVRGSLLCGNIYGDKPNIKLQTDPLLPSVLPESMPAAGGGLVFSGVWTRR